MKVMCGDRVAEHSDDGNFNSAIKCTGFIGCTLLGIFGCLELVEIVQSLRKFVESISFSISMIIGLVSDLIHLRMREKVVIYQCHPIL